MELECARKSYDLLGGVGINVIQGARLAGATTIVAVDVKDSALAFARKFGATHTVNARTEAAVERVQAITGGGVNVVLEASTGR
jgi:Zn-dependent alcohol dehydrogenase